MKKEYLNFAFAFLALCCFSSRVVAQGVTHVITLHVDTNTISNPNPGASCFFSVDEGTTVLDNSSVESFTIYADVGDIIVWQGVSSVSNDAVNIKMIKYSHGPRIFSEDEFYGESSVQGIIVRDTRGQEDNKYEIFFDVIHSGAKYKIDPKLKVGQ